MPHQLTELEIRTLLAPASERWPTAQSGAKTIGWTRAREAVAALHNFAAALDQGCRTAEADPELSPAGVRARRHALGIAALKELHDYPPFAHAQRAIKSELELLNNKLTAVVKPPETVIEAAADSEIRTFIRTQRSAYDFCKKRIDDPRVLRAILSSPLPELAGLTSEQFNDVRGTALRSLAPQQAEAHVQLERARDDLVAAMGAMRRLILERVELKVDGNGDPLPEPAPAPRATVGQPVAAAVH